MNLRQAPTDVPFKDRTKSALAARKYGQVPVTFVERLIDIDRATCEQVTPAVSDPKLVKFSEMVSHNRDCNQYNLIYFIGPEDGFPIKIGITGDVEKRRHSLQSGTWQKLVLHGLIYAEASFPVEQRAHSIAKKCGILQGKEWVWATLGGAVDLVLQAAKELEQPLFTPAMVFYNQGIAMKARDLAVAEQDDNFHTAA